MAGLALIDLRRKCSEANENTRANKNMRANKHMRANKNRFEHESK